jgi:hypothetical protein
MAANNTYVDSNGDRRWRQRAVCPAMGGRKTCGGHLRDGRRFAREVANIQREVKGKKLQRQLIEAYHPKGCQGYLYPQDDVPNEPPECRTFECATCRRNAPFSFGCGDEYLDDCDDCAVKKLRREGKLDD